MVRPALVENIADSSVFGQSPGQISADLAGETAVLNTETGLYFSLNEVAARIWQLLAEPKRMDQIVAAIMEEYEVDHRKCEEDVRTLLGVLLRSRLIERSDEAHY